MDRGESVLLCAAFAAQLLCAGEAVADWAYLTQTEDADWYIDHAETRKRGTMAKVWTLQDFRVPQPYRDGSYQSTKTQFEIRCHSSEWRVFYFSIYRQRMGAGDQVYVQETTSAWRQVDPNTYSAVIFRAACFPGHPD